MGLPLLTMRLLEFCASEEATHVSADGRREETDAGCGFQRSRRTQDMRVSRRIRPSQVGCAASASRRRLRAASLIDSPDMNQTQTRPRVLLVIQPDGQIVAVDDQIGNSNSRNAYDDAGSVAVANSRG